MQFIKEMREPTVALDARGALAGRDTLHRKASAFAESGAGLDILVLEYEMFEGVRVHPHLTWASNSMMTTTGDQRGGCHERYS